MLPAILPAMTFAALDFETANYTDASICAAGVAVFTDGELVQSRHWLVRPPKGHGFFRFTHVHGLTWFSVRGSPEFPTVAAELLPILTSADCVVAHNESFDLRKLRGTLAHFGLDCPALPHLCTYQLARRAWPELASHSLGPLMQHLGRPFKHHHALEDAEAAGHVLLAAMEQLGAEAVQQLSTPQPVC